MIETLKNFQSVDSIERTRTLRNVPKVSCTFERCGKCKIKRMVLWEEQFKERMDWNDGKRQVENGIPKQKLYSVGPPFFIHSDFHAEVTGYSNFWRERPI